MWTLPTSSHPGGEGESFVERESFRKGTPHHSGRQNTGTNPGLQTPSITKCYEGEKVSIRKLTDIDKLPNPG
jgi:hypothetical protein